MSSTTNQTLTFSTGTSGYTWVNSDESWEVITKPDGSRWFVKKKKVPLSSSTTTTVVDKVDDEELF